mgnify:CR=1 FL=1
MRQAVEEGRLPEAVLERDVAGVLAVGVELRNGIAVGRDNTAARLREEADAVIMATGISGGDDSAAALPARSSGPGGRTSGFAQGEDGTFAAGAALRGRCTLVRAMADGKGAAAAVWRFLRGEGLDRHRPFNSIIGPLRAGEVEEYMKEAHPNARQAPADGADRGLSAEQSREEAARCMHCDCRKPVSCKLRRYAEEYDVSQRRYRGNERPGVEKVFEHPRIVYDPGKCIKCGLCVRVTAARRERLGLTFIGRGFDVRVGVPLGETLAKGLAETGDACVEVCPTGALAFVEGNEERAP